MTHAALTTGAELRFHRPYDWGSLLAFLGARAIADVEEVGADSYRRGVRIPEKRRSHLGWIEVTRAPGKSALRVIASPGLRNVLPTVLERVSHLMDLAARPRVISATLGSLAESNPGLRRPGAFDGFELGVRAILGQQVTVAAARTVAGRFAAAFGTPVKSPFSSVTMVFPAAEDIADRKVDDIARLGIIAARSRSIIALAKAITEGTICLERGADPAAVIGKLRTLPGVGEWTAQYIAMRALSWTDAFPHTDYGVMKALGERNPKRVLETAEAWRPWRSYAVIHLWQSLHPTKRQAS